jgi:DNA-binding winged helix-turn-helix (wHTH) protein
MVNLLRKTLRKNGYDSNLIQTNKEKGVRLALKHSARGLPQASTPEW